MMIITHQQHYLEDDNKDQYLSVMDKDYPLINVRGLKASKNLDVGEIVLSIPYQSLWTIDSIIDDSKDPILIKAIGRESRIQHDWISPGIDDIPLLAVVVLYHMNTKQQHQHQIIGEEADNRHTESSNYHLYLQMFDLPLSKLVLE